MQANLPKEASSQSTFSAAGCGLAVLLVVLAGWTILATILFLAGLNALEQDLMIKVFPPADLRWLYQLAYGLAVGIPGLFIWVIGRRRPAFGRIGRVFSFTGLLTVLYSPARLAGIQDSQLGNVLQLAGLVVFLAILGGTQAIAGGRLPRPSWHGIGWGLAIGAGLGLPWVVLCALGSPLDTLLALLVGSGTALAFTWLMQDVFRQDERVKYSFGSFFMDGLLAALALLPLGGMAGANGSGGMLAISIPFLGWAAAGLHRKLDGGMRSNWPVVTLLLGLGLFWPLGFVDLEELSQILYNIGEAAQWAWLAAAIETGLCVLVLLLAVGMMRFWLEKKALRITGLVLGGLGWVVLMAVYLAWGHPGFYGERLFVILKDQADLKSDAQIQDPTERRAAVYHQLVAQADRTQAGLRKTLDATHTRYQPYYLVNAIEVDGEPLLRFWFQSRPEVDRVLIDTRLRPLPFSNKAAVNLVEENPPKEPMWNLTLIHADRVWKELGVTGKGIVVGQSDTGADLRHPELTDSYDRHGSSNDYSWFDPWNGSSSPQDTEGHGTHTLGTMVGKNVGVAPGAEWIACVNLARNLGNPALYLNCMQFDFAPFPQHGDPLHDGKPEWGAQVLNNSWGCPPLEGCDPQALLYAVRALRTAGVFVAVSAGNDGEEGCSTVADPLALYGEVTSVAAIDQFGKLAIFSSLGPVTADGSQRTKPDIAAPGVDVYSSIPGGGYASYSGTSMAGPHVAGVVALMWSANPKLVGNIDLTEQILRQTAAPYTGQLPGCVAPGHPNSAVGYGIVDAFAAVVEALKVK